jgi:hypothetical protein
MGYLILVFGFLFLGWFGGRLIGLGLLCIKQRSLEIGFGYQLRGRGSTAVGYLLVVAGVLVIIPFAWGIWSILRSAVSRCFAVAP